MSAGDIAAIVSAAFAIASVVVAGFAVYVPWGYSVKHNPLFHRTLRDKTAQRLSQFVSPHT